MAFALVLTALVFAQTIRGPHPNRTKSGWLLGPPLLHGSFVVSVNVLIYGYICWLGFWFIRGTEGRERFFMMGWFAGVVLWPVRMLRPDWAVAMTHISAFGLAVALLAVVALLLAPPDVTDIKTPG